MADTNLKLIVTTDRKCHADSVKLGKCAADELGVPLVDRQRDSISDLKRKYSVEQVLIAKKGAFTLDTADGELFFHPNMAQIRLKNIRNGQGDRLVEAMGLTEGMEVLDCTLGFGADAIVESYAVGETGRVVGLEASPVIALITGYGLQHFLATNYLMHAALRRIEVHNMEYLEFLRQQPDKSFDVVYFDPMFRHPLMESHNINPLRLVADHRPLCEEAVAEARRVARRRIVMKENSRSLEFKRLGFTLFANGKYSKISYGIIDV